MIDYGSLNSLVIEELYGYYYEELKVLEKDFDEMMILMTDWFCNSKVYD
jgi:hypothetical protein